MVRMRNGSLDTIRTFDPVVTRISVSNSSIADRLGRDEMTDLGSEAFRPPQVTI